MWVYQFFQKSSDPNDRRTKKLAYHWHGPYRVLRRLGPNTYLIDIPTHPAKEVPINVDRLKKFRGYWSRPYNEDVPSAPSDSAATELRPDDLPNDSYVRRVRFADDDMAYTSVASPLVRIKDKRRQPGKREIEYLAEHADGREHWTPASKLSGYSSFITEFEDQERSESGLPPLRRSPRYIEADREATESPFQY